MNSIIEENNTIVRYMLHDPISNTEGQLINFDHEFLAKADEAGMVFIGIHMDGTREIVPLENVKPIENAYVDGIELVTPKYVDDRIDALSTALLSLASVVENTSGSSSRIANIKTTLKTALSKNEVV